MYIIVLMFSIVIIVLACSFHSYSGTGVYNLSNTSVVVRIFGSYVSFSLFIYLFILFNYFFLIEGADSSLDDYLHLEPSTTKFVAGVCLLCNSNNNNNNNNDNNVAEKLAAHFFMQKLRTS